MFIVTTSLERKKLYEDRSDEEIFKRYHNAGPTARLCLQYTSAELVRFYYERDSRIEFRTARHLLIALLEAKQHRLRIDDIFNKICLVRRSDTADSSFVIGLISPVVRHKLLVQAWKWDRNDRIAMLNRFKRVPGAGGMTGVLFECIHQFEFSKTISLVANAVFRTPSSRWHATFGDFSKSPALKKAQQNALGPDLLSPIQLSLSAKGVKIYNHNEPFTVEENIYYVPDSDTEVAIDSFILHAGHLYLFQFASGVKHDINVGILTSFGSFKGLPSTDLQHFVFVVPKGIEAFNCRHTDDGFLKNHTPYVAAVEELKEMKEIPEIEE